jgi:hypothetical protein
MSEWYNLSVWLALDDDQVKRLTSEDDLLPILERIRDVAGGTVAAADVYLGRNRPLFSPQQLSPRLELREDGVRTRDE